MKKLLLLLMSFVFTIASAQKKEVNYSKQSSSFNKWSVELNVGQNKPEKPYTTGYFSSDPNKYFNLTNGIEHVDLGLRYMFNPYFGTKLDFGYDIIKNQDGTTSLPFETNQYRVALQGVVNLGRLVKFETFTKRFGLLVHGGLQVSQLAPQMGPLKNITEDNGGLIVGITPQFKLARRLALTADFSMLSNVRQHLNWDGTTSSVQGNNLSGTLYNTTLGLTFYLGKNGNHADWHYEIVDEKQADLEKRIADMEIMMNDTDRDGVPDYLDSENNTTTGVAVDNKGRAIDLNNNGVPDELERYIDQKVKNNDVHVNSEQTGKSPLELINQGYINVFFDTDSFYPKSSSTNDIYFVVNYLKENPSSTVDIIGSADVRGNNEYNLNLSKKRAERVKSIVEKAGINASRLNIISQGEEDLGNGTDNLSLVRKVTFRLK